MRSTNRFIKNDFNGKTFERFLKYLGPYQNFFGVRTIEYINLRIQFKEEEIRKFKIVNPYNNKYIDKINEFVKSVLITLSDGIFTNEAFILKNPYYDFEFDYEKMQINRTDFFKFSKRNDRKKPVAIYSKDLKLNLLKKHKIFSNTDIYKYLIVKEEKFHSNKNLLTKNFNGNDSESSYEIIPVPPKKFNINEAIELFIKELNNELTFIYGLGDNSLEYLRGSNPNHIPSDLIVLAFVKDGDYDQKELSRPFEIFSNLERNYIKLFQSKPTMGEDGSTWFFVILKKRQLIEKNREIIDLSNETALFDSTFFTNKF